MKNIIFGIKNYMITIGYCTRVSNETFKKHLIKTCGLDNKKIQIIEIVNTGDRSLTDCYNEILYKSNNDIIVFTHSDLEIRTDNWGNKLLKHFKRNPEYAILGVAGGKEMPVSGMWWENPKTMYGQVYHTHEGKTWLSAYSANVNNQIQETVIVDGVFFSVNRTKIKVGFNTNFDGFHFYDIDFSFNNHINGVKVGVHFDIMINHFSIGQTNEKWEENRIKFSELYKDNLPKSVKRVLLNGESLNIIFAGRNITTDDIELAKKLTDLNHHISLCSENKVNGINIKKYHLHEPPGFKLGDGKWLVNSPNGLVVSEPNKLYIVAHKNYDFILCKEAPVIEFLSKAYVTDFIQFVPNIDITLSFNSKIKKYLTTSNELKEQLVKAYELNPDIIFVVENLNISDLL